MEYPQTRSAESVQVDYVIDEKAATRSVGNANDTVAYIFNWGENDGFAIVAADDRVFPILACIDLTTPTIATMTTHGGVATNN